MASNDALDRQQLFKKLVIDIFYWCIPLIFILSTLSLSLYSIKNDDATIQSRMGKGSAHKGSMGMEVVTACSSTLDRSRNYLGLVNLKQ